MCDTSRMCRIELANQLRETAQDQEAAAIEIRRRQDRLANGESGYGMRLEHEANAQILRDAAAVLDSIERRAS